MPWPPPLISVPLLRPISVRSTNLTLRDYTSVEIKIILCPDNTFKVFIKHKSIRNRKLDDGFYGLANKGVKNPDQSKPDNCVDGVKINDPENVKPVGCNNIPEKPLDPDAIKYKDLDDKDDGKWEATMVDNPSYKDPWLTKRTKHQTTRENGNI